MYYYIIAIITNILVVHGYTMLNPKPVASMLTNLAKDLGHHLLVGHQHSISIHFHHFHHCLRSMDSV